MGKSNADVTVENYVKKLVDGAKAYALSDRSDPFSFARAMCHIRQGLARPLIDGGDGHYTADAFAEERLAPDGSTFTVVVYRNVQRP